MNVSKVFFLLSFICFSAFSLGAEQGESVADSSLCSKEDDEQRKIENTTAFKENLYTVPHLIEAMKKIHVIWFSDENNRMLKKYREIQKELMPENPTEEEIQAFHADTERYQRWNEALKQFMQATKELITVNNLEYEISVIYSFYQDIVFCVAQDRCHRQTACQLFAKDIEGFRLVYWSFIDEWGYLWSQDLAKDLKSFHYDCEQDGLIHLELKQSSTKE